MGDWTFFQSGSGLEFEAKYTLPFLWLAMIDVAVFEAAVPELREGWIASQREDALHLQDPGVAVPTEKALATYWWRAGLIVRSHPEVEPLLADFGRRVKDYGGPEIRIYLLSLAGMSSFDTYISGVQETLAKLDADGLSDWRSAGPLDPGLWVGFEVRRRDEGSFTTTSVAYREASETRSRYKAELAERAIEAKQREAEYWEKRTLRVRLREALRGLRL